MTPVASSPGADGTGPGGPDVPQGRFARAQQQGLTLFADYFQIHLADDGAPGELDWSDQALSRGLAVADGLLGVRTIRNMEVPVVLLISSTAPPGEPEDSWDHVVEADLLCRSGRLVLLGTSDYYPDAARFPVPAAWYRVRASSRGLATLDANGLDADDEYLLEVWPSPPQGVRVLRQYASYVRA